MHIPDLTHHLFLWHLTSRSVADKVVRTGFLPKGPARQDHPARPVWFFSSAYSFVERAGRFLDRRHGDTGFLIALPVDSLNDLWNGQVADEFTVFQPVPADTIVCSFPAEQAIDRAGLLTCLSRQLGPNVIDHLADLSTRADVDWPDRTSAAATLLYLDRARYDAHRITGSALAHGLPGSDGDALARTMRDIDFRFDHYFLRDYYFTYGERCATRALVTSAARRIGPERAFSLTTDPDAAPGHNHVARFLHDVKQHMPRRDLVRAVFELRVRRSPRPERSTAQRIDDWLLEQPESADIAPFYIAHGQDLFHARLGPLAVDLATRMLAAHHRAPFACVRVLVSSPFPMTRLGAIRAFGILRDARALPYLEEALATRWKRMREEAVRSLGQLGTAAAHEQIRRMTEDRAGRVRRAAEQVIEQTE